MLVADALPSADSTLLTFPAKSLSELPNWGHATSTFLFDHVVLKNDEIRLFLPVTTPMLQRRFFCEKSDAAGNLSILAENDADADFSREKSDLLRRNLQFWGSRNLEF